jgi:hypothetical protein
VQASASAAERLHGIQEPFMVRAVAMPAAVCGVWPALRGGSRLPGAQPLTRRGTIRIALSALLLAVTASALLPLCAVSARSSTCSSSCKAAYGNCYKKSLDRSKCQSQLQRCLEGCIRSRK